tara:strand:+ start:685 stop:1155 length:471 start_codon:yes stop_codon:yes gene_type:complete
LKINFNQYTIIRSKEILKHNKTKQNKMATTHVLKGQEDEEFIVPIAEKQFEIGPWFRILRFEINDEGLCKRFSKSHLFKKKEDLSTQLMVQSKDLLLGEYQKMAIYYFDNYLNVCPIVNILVPGKNGEWGMGEEIIYENEFYKNICEILHWNIQKF